MYKYKTFQRQIRTIHNSQRQFLKLFYNPYIKDYLLGTTPALNSKLLALIWWTRADEHAITISIYLNSFATHKQNKTFHNTNLTS